MRAYVVTGEIDDPECGQEVVGVRSSKKLAMILCEEYLNKSDPDKKLTWANSKKHSGAAVKGDYIATYEMFFVNQESTEG